MQGWDQTGSNGANLSFPKEFGIENDEWLIGLVNSGPYLGSCFLGTWLSDPLNHYLGRRGAIFFCSIFLIFPVIGSAFTQTWEQVRLATDGNV